MDLSFGEQVKVLLKRQNMTIKDLAAILEKQTGKPTSRQNLTQKLGRNNFQEQDMREIARALNCGLFIQMVPLSELRPITPVTPVPVVEVADNSLPSVEAILAAAQIPNPSAAPASSAPTAQTVPAAENPLAPANTPASGNIPAAENTPASANIPAAENIPASAHIPAAENTPVPAKPAASEQRKENAFYIEKKDPDKEVLTKQISALLNPLMHSERKKRPERTSSRFPFGNDAPVSSREPQAAYANPTAPAGQQAYASSAQETDTAPKPAQPSVLPDSINPMTGEEYLNNTVRPCPHHPGYIEVYDRSEHAWVETNEAEFQRFQQQKRMMLGADYEPPIYI